MSDNENESKIELKAHPFAEIFPMMSENSSEFEQLSHSISQDGIKQPIWLYDRKILDGRNRYKIYTTMPDVELPTETFKGNDVEALQFVITLNMRRRHMTESQRAITAVRYSRLVPTVRGKGAESDKTVADMFKTSTTLMKRALTLLKSDNDEVIKAVEEDRLVLDAVKQFLKLPRELQQKALGTDNPSKRAREFERNQKSQMKQTDHVNSAVKASRETGELKFGVIYIDPPWTFETYSEEGKKKSPEQHYPTMTLDDIAGLDIHAAPICTMFLWTTVPHLLNAGEIMQGWGFEYKSAIFWNKVNPGTGYWSRNLIEVLLIGTKGDVPKPTPETQFDQLYTITKKQHSEKPFQIADAIHKLYPTVPKIEMFARKVADRGDTWFYWGNEIGEEIVQGKPRSEAKPNGNGSETREDGDLPQTRVQRKGSRTRIRKAKTREKESEIGDGTTA